MILDNVKNNVKKLDTFLLDIFDYDQLIKYLKTKYGNILLVSEDFYKSDFEEENLPFEAIVYSEYQYPSNEDLYYMRRQGRSLDPAENITEADIECVFTYDINFDILISFLREDYYSLEKEELLSFFNLYVSTPEERKKYMNRAATLNAKGKLPRDKYTRFTRNYRIIT